MCLATPSAPLIGEKSHHIFSMENVLNIESKRSSLHNASGCIRIQRSSLQNTSEKLITFERKERYTILNGVRAPFVGKWTLTYSPAHRRLIGCS